MKKITAAVIAIVMAACMLTACTTGADTGADEAKTTPATVAEETTKKEKATTEASEKKTKKEKTTKEEETTEEEETTKKEKATEAEEEETTAAETEKETTAKEDAAVAETVKSEAPEAEAKVTEKAADKKSGDTKMTKLSKELQTAMASKKYGVKMYMDDNGEKANVAIYSDGKKTRMDIVGVSEGEEVDMTIIIKDGKTYMLDNIQKAGMSTASGDTSSLDSELDSISELNAEVEGLISSEKETFEGKEYICETYENEGEKLKCYFTDGVDNKVIVVMDKTRIDLELTAAPTSSMFDIPSDYSMMDI